MKQVLVVVMLVAALHCGAQEIVVLTDTPVAEFMLPDGSVLANAYVWKRSSQGLMIMHDGGSYFLNFKLLPGDWKAVYLAPPEEEGLVVVQSVNPKPKVEPARDRYKVMDVLRGIPGLDDSVRHLSLGTNYTEMADQKILLLGVLQSLLLDHRKEAKRFHLYIEENEYELEYVDIDQLLISCATCGGDGRLEKTCRRCDGSGKCLRCKGEGTLESTFQDTLLQCTACRGTGKCLACKGDGNLTSTTCRECKGAGRLVNQLYCEVLRGRIIREVNMIARPDRGFSISSGASAHFDKMLSKLPGLDEPAREYYSSEEYEGGMDTNLVVAGLMYSLLKENYGEAKRFKLMLEVLFPESEVLDSTKYLKPCERCSGTGWIDQSCQKCDGSGKCSRCDGEGKRKLEIGGDKVHCTTCRGSGECRDCQGRGTQPLKCKACAGKGRIINRQRSEIKLGILVERLNTFYARRKISVSE